MAAVRRRFYTNEVRLGADTYRVIHPVRPIVHAPMHETGWGVEMYVNKAATGDFALAWWLAARSPHSLVYLSLRQSPDCEERSWYCGRKLDLVLAHHDLAFPPSRWKQVRARLRPTGIQQVTLPERPFRVFDPPAHYLRKSRDHVRYTVAADTLFLTSSQHGYELDGETVMELLDDAPATLATRPDKHTCAEIDLGRWHARSGQGQRRDTPLRLHVVCCNQHWLKVRSAGTSAPAAPR